MKGLMVQPGQSPEWYRAALVLQESTQRKREVCEGLRRRHPSRPGAGFAAMLQPFREAALVSQKREDVDAPNEKADRSGGQ